MTKLNWSKRKIAATILLCATLISSISIWQMEKSPNAQAAIINPHPGLVGWWRFDEGSGIVAGDSSGNNNNGTINGAAWVAGRYGSALSFNGVSNNVAVPNNSLLSPSTLTIEAWFNPSTVAPSSQQIVGKQNVYNEYRLILFGSTICGQIYDSSHEYTVSSAASGVFAQTGIWQLVTMTYDQTNLKLYVNGILVNTLPLSASINHNTSPLTIGSNNAGIYYFSGSIDEVRLYNYALSASDVQSDFQLSPDFSPHLSANVPQGATQVITTISWQGTGTINVTIATPSQNYTESMMSEYQKTTYSTTNGGQMSMLNIKRLSISLSPLSVAQVWNITLTYDSTVSAYQVSVETQ